MLDKLRNQERLSPAEEYRIEKWIRIGILAGMDFILICTYAAEGADPELVLYKKR